MVLRISGRVGSRHFSEARPIWMGFFVFCLSHFLFILFSAKRTKQEKLSATSVSLRMFVSEAKQKERAALERLFLRSPANAAKVIVNYSLSIINLDGYPFVMRRGKIGKIGVNGIP